MAPYRLFERALLFAERCVKEGRTYLFLRCRYYLWMFLIKYRTKGAPYCHWSPGYHRNSLLRGAMIITLRVPLREHINCICKVDLRNTLKPLFLESVCHALTLLIALAHRRELFQVVVWIIVFLIDWRWFCISLLPTIILGCTATL